MGGEEGEKWLSPEAFQWQDIYDAINVAKAAAPCTGTEAVPHPLPSRFAIFLDIRN